jgi:membrane protease YdiL (CAAX protease family)
MENEPQPTLGFDPLTGQPDFASPALEPPRKKLLAPVWHTVLIIVIMLGNSAFTAHFAAKVMGGSHAVSGAEKYASYISSIVLELFLLAILWVGLRINHTGIRELVGGKWRSPEDFLLDLVIGFGFAVVSYFILGGLSYAMGMAKPSQVEDTKKLASMLAPHSWGALVVFILLSATAGFVEELIFRGYLQQQIGILSGKVYVGVVASALVFGGGHGYEGVRRMVLIFIFGMMFSALTLWRKNLRSAMIGHAIFDSAQGVLLFFITRSGLLKMH